MIMSRPYSEKGRAEYDRIFKSSNIDDISEKSDFWYIDCPHDTENIVEDIKMWGGKVTTRIYVVTCSNNEEIYVVADSFKQAVDIFLKEYDDGDIQRIEIFIDDMLNPF